MRRILVAEDEVRIAAFVSKGLTAAGFTVTVVSDGQAALDHALTGSYDLLVLDIGLPRLDGFAVLRRLRELPAPAADLAQELVDACFAYLELGFRNGGISDIAVPKRMKKIGQMFYGRIRAYETALETGEPQDLVEALRRNASPGEPASAGAVVLEAYAGRAQAHLAGLDLEAILRADALFPAPIELETSHDA